jgi:hypothetical protein
LRADNRTAQEWQTIADLLLHSAPRLIEDPALTRPFRNAGRRFDFGFNWDPHFVNARVKREGSIYRVRFGLGLLAHLDGLARWMCAESEIRELMFLPRRFPNDDLSSYFLMQWFDWIIFHEAGHVLGGHLDLQAASGHAAAIDEIGSGQSSSRPADLLFRRAIEADADIIGASFFFSGVGQRAKHPGGSPLYQSSEPGVAILYDLGVSFAIFFSFWDQLLEGVAAQDHPPPHERALLFALFGLRTYRDVSGHTDPDELGQFQLGLAQAFDVIGPDGENFVAKLREHKVLAEYQRILRDRGLMGFRQIAIAEDWLNDRSP